MQESLLQLQNIRVHFGGVKALDGVNVSINEGEIVALMGPNGAGKSTILKAIFGLVGIESGEIVWEGQKIKPISYEIVKRGISFVPQGRRVFRNLTIKENLEIGGWIVKDRRLIKERLKNVLEIFPVLKEKLNQKSRTLSGGQQQMLAIGRGLMTDPKVLLLDEPTLGLAPKIVKEVFEKISEIRKKRNTTILIVEHNLKSALEIVDRAYLLDRGKIIIEDKPEKILANNILTKVFLGEKIVS